MQFLRCLKFQKDFLKQKQSYLKKGTYVLHENLRTYILKEHIKDNWFPTTQSTFKISVKVLIARILFSVNVRKNGNEFLAESVYFTNLQQTFNRDAKFFDYNSKRLRTVCQNQRRYDLYMCNRKYFEKYLPMVELLLADDEHFIFEERMIDKRSVPDDEWKAVFTKLFDIYSKYNKTAGIDKTNITYKLSHISSCPPEKIESLVTLYRQHGDLSSDNFIYDQNGNIYFIDFDHANYYPMFYDIFFLMVFLQYWKGIDIGIKLLTEGVFNKYFDNSDNYGFTSVYEAFLLFSDYFLEVCNKEGLSLEWQAKYNKLLSDILEKLKR